MNHNRVKAAIAFVAMLILVSIAAAQSDLRRSTTAITYPLNQTIEVAFHGTTRLPRLKGNARVRRQGRRGTRVELNLENLPPAYQLRGDLNPYVLLSPFPDRPPDNPLRI